MLLRHKHMRDIEWVSEKKPRADLSGGVKIA